MNEGQLVQAKPRRLLSQDLVQTTELNNNQIYEVGSKIKKYKHRLTDTMDKMDDYMDKHTKKERDAVEEALKVLQHKIKKVQNDDYYKTLENDFRYIEEKLNITMENIFPQYANAVKRIYNSYPDKKERSQKLLEFHEVIGDAFLTKDEKKILTLIKSKVKEIPHKMVDVPMIGF